MWVRGDVVKRLEKGEAFNAVCVGLFYCGDFWGAEVCGRCSASVLGRNEEDGATLYSFQSTRIGGCGSWLIYTLRHMDSIRIEPFIKQVRTCLPMASTPASL